MNDNTHNAIRGVLFAALIFASVFFVAASASAAVTSADRSVADTTTPGGEVTVTVTTTVDASNPVALSEDFSGPVASGQFESVTINGNQAGFNDLLTTAVDSDGAAITVSDSAVSAGDEVVFTYTITAASNAAGQDIDISGSVTSGDQASLTDDTVSVQSDGPGPSPANFQVSNLQPASATVPDGTLIDVSALVENTGDQGTQSVELAIDGTTIASQQVTLNNGQSTTVAFTDVDTGALGPGSYTHEIASEDDSETGSLTVTEDSGPAPGEPQPGPAPPALDNPSNVGETNIEDVTITGGYAFGADNVDSTSIDGLTILDDYPQHGASIFDPLVGSVYAEESSLNFSDIDPRFQPVAVGQHTGLVGLPVQTDAYEAAEDRLNFQQEMGISKPEQQVFVTFEIDGDADDDTQTIVADFDAPAAAGLELNTTLSSVQVVGNGANAVTDTTIDAAANEITATLETTADTDAQLVADVVYEPADPVEGLDVAGGINDLAVIGESPNGDTERDRFLAAEVGATGISHADVDRAAASQNGGFLGEPVEDETGAGVNLSSSNDPNGMENPGSFLVWQGQDVTFETEQRDNTIAIYEAVEREDGNQVVHARGDLVTDLGTAPGQVANLDTSSLAPGQYFVDFESSSNNDVVVLDVKALNLGTSVPDEVPLTDTAEINVNTSDITGGDVEAWLLEAGDDEIGDVIHVERDTLPGTGNRAIPIDPENDLDGTGEYRAIVMHTESEVMVTTDTFEVVDPEDAEVNIESPTTADRYKRGDIVPIELSFENTDTGTLTFGDREENNVEINLTVRDVDEDGSGTIYLNTFQTGAGLVMDDGDMVQNTPDDDPFFDPVNRNHGFFVDPNSDGTALVGEDDRTAVAHPSIDILGGPQNGAVLDSQTYDLVSVAGEDPYTTEDTQLDDRSVLTLEEREGSALETWTAPGLGSAEIEPETESGVFSAINDTITLANGSIAEDDYLVLDVQSDGLEGLLHEAVIANESLDEDDFLAVRTDSSDDDIISEEFFSATGGVGVLDLNLLTTENDSTVPGNEEETILDLRQTALGVIAGTDDDGNLNRYFLPIRLEPENDALTSLGELEPGQQFVSEFEISPDDDLGDQVNVPVNEVLSRGDEGETVSWQFVDAEAGVETNENGTLEVPRQQDVTVAGTTTVAAGTPLDVTLTTVSGQETPFVKQFTGITTQNTAGSAPNAWSITVDFTQDGELNLSSGTEFEVDVFRSGVAGALTAEPVPGRILSEPSVETLSFEDQQSSGSSVVVDAVETNQGGFVAIENANGTVLGMSSELAEDTLVENIPVALAPAIETTQDLTAVALLPSEDPYMVNDSRVTETATVTVGGGEAALRVTGIDPVTAEVEVGTTVDVSATVENLGAQEGSTNVTLTIGGTEIGSEAVTVAAGESATVSFSADTSALGQGEFTHTVSTEANSLSGSLTVTGPVEPAAFEVSNLDPQSAAVAPGQTVGVSADVANTGGESGSTTVELSIDGTTLSKTVTLPAGATQTVTFAASTSGLSPGEYTHTVSAGESSVSGTLTVQAPAAFEVSGLDPMEATVTQGDAIDVSADVENTGTVSGSTTATLTIDGSSVATQSVSDLAGGETTTVTFSGVSTSELSPGEYTHAVSAGEGSQEGTLTVQAPANFTVSNLNPMEASVTQGTSINVSADVENTGDVSGSTSVSLTIDGDSIDSQEVTVEGGSSTTVTFSGVSTSELSPGEYTHAVSADGSSVEGTLTVEAADDGGNETDDGNETGDNESDGSGPGFGVVAAALALLGAALLAMRRQDN